MEQRFETGYDEIVKKVGELGSSAQRFIEMPSGLAMGLLGIDMTQPRLCFYDMTVSAQPLYQIGPDLVTSYQEKDANNIIKLMTIAAQRLDEQLEPLRAVQELVDPPVTKEEPFTLNQVEHNEDIVDPEPKEEGAELVQEESVTDPVDPPAEEQA